MRQPIHLILAARKESRVAGDRIQSAVAQIARPAIRAQGQERRRLESQPALARRPCANRQREANAGWVAWREWKTVLKRAVYGAKQKGRSAEAEYTISDTINPQC